MAIRPTAGSKAGQGTDGAELARQIAALRADLEALATSLGDLAQGKASSLLDQLHGRVAELGGTVEASMMDKLAGAEATFDGVTDYARRKPLHALAIAAGVGMVLGLLFGRK